jgi:DNA-binding NtrC family response regulator
MGVLALTLNDRGESVKLTLWGPSMRSQIMAKTILIVDDEPTARDALARLLQRRGYTVRTAGDSQEAIQKMAESPADTVLLDIDLPHVPGDSIATFLNIRYPQARIHFMSGQYDMVNPERFGENTSYFRKPLDIEALLEVLESNTASSDRA